MKNIPTCKRTLQRKITTHSLSGDIAVCGRFIAKSDRSNISGDIMHLSLVNRTILMQHIGDKLVFPIQHYLRATYARHLCHRRNGQNAAIIGALTLLFLMISLKLQAQHTS